MIYILEKGKENAINSVRDRKVEKWRNVTCMVPLHCEGKLVENVASLGVNGGKRCMCWYEFEVTCIKILGLKSEFGLCHSHSFHGHTQFQTFCVKSSLWTTKNMKKHTLSHHKVFSKTMNMNQAAFIRIVCGKLERVKALCGYHKHNLRYSSIQ